MYHSIFRRNSCETCSDSPKLYTKHNILLSYIKKILSLPLLQRLYITYYNQLQNFRTEKYLADCIVRDSEDTMHTCYHSSFLNPRQTAPIDFNFLFAQPMCGLRCLSTQHSRLPLSINHRWHRT